MLKLLLVLFLICLLLAYLGYRVLRFLSTLVGTVGNLHERGQQDGVRSRSGWPHTEWPGPGGAREKDITDRARVLSDSAGADDAENRPPGR